MLFLLSPAKSLDYATPVPPEVLRHATAPAFTDEAAALVELLRPLTPAQLADLMGLSSPLAALNVARWAAWSRVHDDDNSKPAVLAFDGDVYGGLDARTLTLDELLWAQSRLAILSGLYGVLRPLDRLQPYRLEMGTRLAHPRGRDLCAFWGARIAPHLAQRLAQEGGAGQVIVNLASQEYARAVDRRALPQGVRVVECVFESRQGGAWKVVGLHAKRARGLMARFAVQQRVVRVPALREFEAEGWRFDAAASSEDRLVFRRRPAEEVMA